MLLHTIVDADGTFIALSMAELQMAPIINVQALHYSIMEMASVYHRVVSHALQINNLNEF